MVFRVDYVGVTEGDDGEGGEGGFVTIKPPKPPGKSRKLLTVDVDDWIEPSSRMVFELDHVGNIVRPEEVIAKAEERGVRFNDWFNSWLWSISPRIYYAFTLSLW